MSQGRRIAAVLALTAVAMVVEAASAPALGVAPVSTPTVTTPTVTVPPVEAPVVTTPSVTVPPASTPKVTTPSVSAPPAAPPKVSAPKVTAPKVSTPQVTAPKVSTPKSDSGSKSPKTLVPSVTVGGGGGGGGGGLVDAVSPVLSTGTAGSVTRAATGGVARTAAGGYTAVSGSGNPALVPVLGGTPGGPGGLAGPGGFGGLGGPGGFAGGPGSPVFALGVPALGEGSGGVSAFAAAVGALAGCFYALTPFEQQVLTVRTGLDGRQPLTRPQVAALLGTSPKQIGQIERGALGRLRGAAATDGCMPVAAGGPANALTAFIGGPFGPVGVVTAGLPPTARTEPAAGGERLASISIADRLAGLPDGSGQASLSVLLIIVTMLSGALAALLFEARRQVH